MKPQFDVTTAGNMPKVVIRGAYHGSKTFPSLNNLLAAYSRKPVIGSSLKKKYQNICAWEIRDQLGKWKAKNPLIVHYRYFEPKDGHYRDVANVHSFASKVFLDSLQDCGVIPTDGPRWILNETHDFDYVDGEPYIEIYMEEVTTNEND